MYGSTVPSGWGICIMRSEPWMVPTSVAPSSSWSETAPLLIVPVSAALPLVSGVPVPLCT